MFYVYDFWFLFLIEKSRQAKSVSKVWSEQESSDDNENVQKDLLRKHLSPKRRRTNPKCSKLLEKEFLESNTIKPPTSPINSTSNLLLTFIIQNMIV